MKRHVRPGDFPAPRTRPPPASDSAKIYRMDTFTFTHDELAQAMLELCPVNDLRSCYLRPIVMRGYGDMGVNGSKNPVDVYMACWEWGKYLGEEAHQQRRGCLRFQLDPHRAQYPARACQSRRELHEFAADQDGSDGQRIRRRHRA